MRVFSFFKKQYLPLNTIEVSERALLHNYSYLSNLDNRVQVAPVLKSNAYGHGLEIVGRILDKAEAPFFCVDSIYEGYTLLKAGIKTPILIMGYINPENLKVKKLPFSFAVYDKVQIDAIYKYQPHAGVHIFVDTGMHREGISIEELPLLLIAAKALRVEGLMSHLATGENHERTKSQIEMFEQAQNIVRSAGFKPKWIHIANSSGLLHHKAYHGKIGNLARVGIASYGVDPENKDKNLQPALSFYSTLGQVKKIYKGDKVGYDHTFTAKQDMTIGILSAGYNDGVDRRLSNCGFVSINNTYCPIIGRVSMNLTTVDVSNVKNVKVGDRVTIFSSDRSAKNAVANAAEAAGAISYDLLVKLHASTKRFSV